MVAGLLRDWSCSIVLGGANCNGRHAELVNKIGSSCFRVGISGYPAVLKALFSQGKMLVAEVRDFGMIERCPKHAKSAAWQMHIVPRFSHPADRPGSVW